MRDGLVFVCKRERWKEWVCVPCWATPSSPHLDNGPGVQETRRQQWDSTILTSIYHFMDEPLNQKATKRLSSRPWGGGRTFLFGDCMSFLDPHGFSLGALASSHSLTGYWLWMVGPMMIWPLNQGVTPPSIRGMCLGGWMNVTLLNCYEIWWGWISLESISPHGFSFKKLPEDVGF